MTHTITMKPILILRYILRLYTILKIQFTRKICLMTTVPGAKGKCMPVREDEKFDLEPCLWLHYRLSESVTHIIVSVWSYRRNNESRLRRRKKFIVPRRFSILLNCDVRLKFNHSRINLHLKTQPQNTVHENPYYGLVCIGLSNSLPHWPFARNIYRSR